MNKRLFLINKKFFIKKGTYFKKGIYLLSVSLLSLFIYSAFYSDSISKGIAENLVRLHVVAESDSVEDQELKLSVRDAVIDYMYDKLSEAKDIGESKKIIEENLNNITKVAENVIRSSGKEVPVTATLGIYPFPTKKYGDITLPAGNYHALKVVIGNGKGANWWCVLFPPLCIVDVTHGTISESVKEELKNALTDDEYKIISSAESDDDIPVKIKFKIVEFFQNSKIRFSGLISKIFGD
ncbi:MAG TPA: stage II sporulation protein R [Clostridiaceae bacterium]|nr:stage II sporulation protein R [Clostridiaceae bacterium]